MQNKYGFKFRRLREPRNLFLVSPTMTSLLQCSASCGDGVQRRQVLCRPAGHGTAQESAGCSPRSRPPSSRSCRLLDCPSRYRWREGDWQAVSPGGVRGRKPADFSPRGGAGGGMAGGGGGSGGEGDLRVEKKYQKK